MQLSRQSLKDISSVTGVVMPGNKIFSLPEKVLQFGTGVLLRGLPDYFIDKANRQDIFNGRVVVIKSTAKGGVDEFDKQDNLYTLCIKGMENNKESEEFIINSSISRVLSAKEAWSTILECAHNPELKIIISNTTEVGITLTEDNIHLSPPNSFPGKLLSFLYERYRVFNGDKESGIIIIPAELIVDNGTKLRSIVLELAKINDLEEKFIKWLTTKNHFCNSLVDRIVPGKLPGDDQVDAEKKLGYTDELMIMAEPYRLWAIETASEEVRQTLSFSRADEGVIIAPDIEKFRELKLRLLNGTHTFSCGLAFLAGFKTVKEAMNDKYMAGFIHHLAINEIAIAMSNEKIPYEEAYEFANKVLDRFRNPFLDHQWLNITLQYSAKMKMRNVSLLLQHYRKFTQVPEGMALGFAAYLLFMKCHRNEKGNFVGDIAGSAYLVQDERAGYFAEKWKDNDVNQVVDDVLSDKDLWQEDLSLLNEFSDSVKMNLKSLIQNGTMNTLRGLIEKQGIVKADHSKTS